MTPSVRAVAVCLVACAALPSPRLSSAQSTGLTGAPQIARVYNAILDARFDQVPGLLQQTCGAAVGPLPPGGSARPHPNVCALLDTVSLWWQIQLDPNNLSRDAEFERKVNAVVASTEAWVRSEPRRAEAWFYLGGAYGARGQWRVLRGEVLSAARDGKRIKESLERSLSLDPKLLDAYFGIGLYHYYADVAPAAAKVLRFLLFLPGGNKAQGMREMLQARDGGQLLRGEADYQLHILYLWYEKQPLRARTIVEELRDRYPGNPHFPQVIAEITDTYLHDDTGTLRAWQAMLSAAQVGRLSLPAMAEARARLGLATQFERLHESDAAAEQARAVILAAPGAPFGAVAQAWLLRAQALDRLGSRGEALEAYRQALALATPADPLSIATRARSGLRTTPNADTARAYRLSLEGWRAFERGALGDAARLLTQSRAVRPDDPVATYRHARVLSAQGNTSTALTLLEGVIRRRTMTPPVFFAYACLDAATLHEQTGMRARAIELFTLAANTFGADERTKEAAQRALTRLTPARPAGVR